MIVYDKSQSVISVHCHVQLLLMACSHILFTVLKCHLELKLGKDHTQTQSLSGLTLRVSYTICNDIVLYMHTSPLYNNSTFIS